MKLFLLCLISAAGIGYCTAAIPPAVATMLINKGMELGAPFTEKAADGIMKTLMGSGRAARSSEVFIFNLANRDFHLVYNKCRWGGYSTDLFPESTIPKGQSTAFGIESGGFMTGVKCFIKYRSNDGSWFKLLVDNPYWSSNDADEWASDNLDVVSVLGKGHNNQVRFTVKSKSG